MFCDLVGSTALAELLALRGEQNAARHLLAPILG